jgi:tetratricopeptide (TPR) repeat protein
MRRNAVEYVEGDQPVPGLRLVQFLGTGSFGEVWKAVRSGETECAVKIVRFDEPTSRREFRGLQRIKSVRHPNLVRIHAFWLKGWDGGVLDGDPSAPAPAGDHRPRDGSARDAAAESSRVGVQARELIVEMDLCEQTLFDRLQECRGSGLEGIPVAELLPYLAEAAKALDYLNRPCPQQDDAPTAVQHCDIKPQNIMLVGGSIQICDFGLVRDVGRMPTTPDAAATIAYVAPELITGGTPSHATDQYSLAVSYYELRTGRLPYAKETIGAVTQAVLNGELDFSAVSAGEAAVLRRATARNPDDRYPSCREMADSLRKAALSAEPVAAPARSRRMMVAGILATAGTALLAGWCWTKTSPPAETRFARGLELAAESRFAEAVAEIEAAAVQDRRLADRSEYARVLAEYGKALLEQANAASRRGEDVHTILATAEHVLRQAVQRHPTNPDAWSRLGVLHTRCERFDDAVDAFGRAIALRPEDSQEYVNRGEAYRRLKNPESAIRDLTEAVRLDPANGAAHYALGRAYFESRQFKQALPHFNTALERFSPASSEFYAPGSCHVLRGFCRYQLDGLAAANTDFAAMLDEPQEIPAALFHTVASLYESEGLVAEAVRFEEQAVRLADGSPARQSYEEKLRSYREHSEKADGAAAPAPSG